MKPRFPIFLAVMISQLVPANAALEFSGYMIVGSDLSFVVTETESQNSSDWLKLGDTFRQHKLLNFDKTSEVLTVEVSGTSLRLHLKSSRVKDAKGDSAIKAEIYISRRPDGSFAVDGRTTSEEELRTHFRRMALSGVPVEVFIIQEPAEPNQAKSWVASKLPDMLHDSGVKKWRVRAVAGPKRN